MGVKIGRVGRRQGLEAAKASLEVRGNNGVGREGSAVNGGNLLENRVVHSLIEYLFHCSSLIATATAAAAAM